MVEPARWSSRIQQLLFMAGAGALTVGMSDSAGAWTFGDGVSISRRESLSGNGRYVAFESDATNLVPGDTNGVRDVFVLDTQNGSASAETHALMDREVRSIIERLYARAVGVIRSHRAAVEALGNALLERETLDGREALGLMIANGLPEGVSA